MTFENNPFKGSEQLDMVAELRVQCFVIFLFNTLLAQQTCLAGHSLYTALS